MSKIQNLASEAISNASNSVLNGVAKLMVNLGTSAVSLSAFPFWHYEAKMPESMLNEITEVYQ